MTRLRRLTPTICAFHLGFSLVLHGMISLGASHGAWQEVGLNLLVRQSVQAGVEAYATAYGVATPTVEFHEDPTNPECMAIPQGMAIAIMALVHNAWDANAEAEADVPIVVSVQAGPEEASVTFRDEGCGMTPEVLEKVTTPFFTTKRGDNQGTGLGLIHAAEVARSHGGTIVMTSESGQCTTVTMTLRLRPPAATDGRAAGFYKMTHHGRRVAEASSTPPQNDDPRP